MTEAETRIPWLPSREAVARVARHLGCTLEAAELRVVDAGRGGRIKARGVVAGQQVSPLRPAWNGTVDLVSTVMRPLEVSYEITNVELCYIDLVAAGLLPAPAEKARWSTAEAVAYLVKGVPLPWAAWQGAGASPAEIDLGLLDLSEAIREGVPAWGWHPLERGRKQIPSDDFRDETIDIKAFPVSVAHPPKVVVHIHGNVGTWPPSRIAEYTRTLWRAVEVDAARLRQAHPRPLTTRAEPVSPGAETGQEESPSSGKPPSEKDLKDFVAGYIKSTTDTGRTPTKAGLYLTRDALPGATRKRLFDELKLQAKTLPPGRPRKNRR